MLLATMVARSSGVCDTRCAVARHGFPTLAAALTRCSEKLTTVFSKASTKYGGSCAVTEPSAKFDAYLSQCSDDSTAAAGGAALPDYVGDLSAYNADLTTCTGDLAACEVAMPPARLLKTGQTTVYGAGSDGDLELGVAQGYVDNGDGPITDKDNTYSWSGASLGSTNVLDGTAATTFLAALNAGGGFAGHTDWRLPNQTELYSLVNLQNVNSAVSAAFNAGCVASCTVPGFYWSSCTYANTPLYAWFVFFNDGFTFAGDKASATASVRFAAAHELNLDD